MASAERISFPQKESSKEKTKVQQPIAHSAIGNSTIGRVAQPSSAGEQQIQANDPKQLAIDQSAQAKAERRARSIKAQEIDDYVFRLVIEGLVSEDYQPFMASACTLLGLQRVNHIVIQVKQGQNIREPQRLLAWKIKAAVQLHHKRIFYEQNLTSVQPELPPES